MKENQLSNVYVAMQFDYFIPFMKQIHGIIDPNDLVTGIPHAQTGLETEPHTTILYSTFENKKYDVNEIAQKTINKQRTILQSTYVNISKVGMFDTNDDYDVIKYDITNDNCTLMNSFVRTQFGLLENFKEYKAHLTIAYVKKGLGEFYVNKLQGIINADFIPTSLKFVVNTQHENGETTKARSIQNVY